jgi:hypothetical protein
VAELWLESIGQTGKVGGKSTTPAATDDAQGFMSEDGHSRFPNGAPYPVNTTLPLT